MIVVEFIEGPLFYFAAAVFVIGALWRIIGILRLGRRTDLSAPRAASIPGAIKALFRHLLPHYSFYNKTKLHIFAGYLFHLGLFAVLFFAAPHIAFLEKRVLGFGWEAMPRWAFIVTAQAAFAGLILLWFRRIADPTMRQISDADDHIGSWLTFIAMLTGCLALQESSVALRVLHMLSVEIWLIYFPFSRLMHAFTFVLSRSYTGVVYGRRGITP